MLRAFVLVTLAVASVPVASAEPIESIVWEPGGIHTGDADEYYLKVVLSDPEPPRTANETEDCAYPDRPHDLFVALDRDLTLPPGVSAIFPLSTWYPTCLMFPVGVFGVEVAYASYDVSTGRYYIEVETPLPAFGPHPQSATTAFTGTTGVSSAADCLTCPSPP